MIHCPCPWCILGPWCMSMSMLHVQVKKMLHVISMLHVHVHATCPFMQQQHVHVQATRPCPCCMSLLHVHAYCTCFLSMSILLSNSMDMGMEHGHGTQTWTKTWKWRWTRIQHNITFVTFSIQFKIPAEQNHATTQSRFQGLLDCVMSAYQFDVCSTVWRLPTWMVSALLYSMMSAYLYTWCLPICMISVYLYDCFLTVWCFPILNIRYRINPISSKFI